MKCLLFVCSLLWIGIQRPKNHTVDYPKLSYTFNYAIIVEANGAKDDYPRGAKITLLVVDKKNKAKYQRIGLTADYLYEEAYRSGVASRSYITGYNKNKEIADYDFGDLIVADLNFDGREDVVVKHDSGGNGGPLYNFYLQDEKGKFKMDRFLTDTVWSFPRYINSAKKTITTQVHANVGQEQQATYLHNAKTKRWKMIKQKLVDI